MSRMPPAPESVAGVLAAAEAPLPAALHAAWWPLARLGDALEALARASGLATAAAQPLGAPPADAADPAAEARRWIDWAGAQLGLEVVPVDTAVPELPALLRGAGPVVLPYKGTHGLGVFLLLPARRGGPRLLAPDGSVQRCSLEALRRAMVRHREAPHLAEIEALLAVTAVPPQRHAAVRDALLRERLATERIGPCWMLRLPAAAPFRRQLVQARLPRRFAAAMAVFGVLYACEIGGWALIGRAALGGRPDTGWLAAWLLLMLSMVPLRLAGGWLQSSFALDAGRILKSRLLAGALRMDLDRVRTQGVGHLLGRVIESQALESLALNGGLTVAVAVLEWVCAAWILAHGAAPVLQLALMVAWLLVCAALARRYVARLRRWTHARLALTHTLVEQMVGHRTRLAQERAGRRDAQEDAAMHAYLHDSRAMDEAAIPMFAGAPTGWMLVALAGLAPAIAAGASPAALAVSLGGMLFAQRAFGGIASGLAALARAGMAWRQVAPIFHAGGGSQRAAATAPQPFLPATQQHVDGAPLIEAAGLGYAYRAGAPVLDGASLHIAHGERLLLEGGSGGGKSTLAALLVGLRTPQQGRLRLGGRERTALGDDWHRLATAAPQFHENHVLSGTLAFNLLMGRTGPPSPADLADAEALCRALGLGTLIDHMPAGLQQRVGETGWQLSHGERSRVFLARALLQGAALTVMDESFAALDPETLETCLRCTQAHAQTLLVIAHP